MQYTKGEPLEARVQTLRRLSRWATTAIEAWEFIDASIDDEDLSDLLSDHRPYLVVSAHGHRELGFLYLNALFETRDDTVNIRAVCKHLRQHGVCTDDIEADLDQHKVALKKLYSLRGGAIGHRTSARSYDETFAKIQMTRSELDALLALAMRSAMSLAKAIELAPESPLFDPIDSLKKMLTDLADRERTKRATSPWT